MALSVEDGRKRDKEGRRITAERFLSCSGKKQKPMADFS